MDEGAPVSRIAPHFQGLTSEDTGFQVILDRFETLDAVSKEIKSVVDVECGLIFGIDYSMSNKIQGKVTFGGKSLHDTSAGVVNPYQEIICILGETLEPLDDDGIIPAYGFGDKKVKDKGIFSLKEQGECEGFLEVLQVYNATTKTTVLGGPTNFAPIIEKAVRIVKDKKMFHSLVIVAEGQVTREEETITAIARASDFPLSIVVIDFHILVIVADGQVTREEETIAAIVRASDFPLSIVVIGVGDGPWKLMVEFDDKLPERRFDNFQFVEYHKAKSTRCPETAVALAALMEVPDQYKAIKELELLKKLQLSECD